MNRINFLSDNNSSFNNSPKERIESKESFYHVSDSLKSNKLAFAFFLDQYTVKASDKEGVKELKALSNYEWFAGSLTAEQFAKELKGFIASPHSSSLKPELKQKLEEFASTLENSNGQGYLIDLVRSTDLKLILLILTGTLIGESKIEAGNEKIREISLETLKQIKSLKEGEKRIFLVGSLLHETRLTVERTKEGWEVCYFDSTQTEFSEYQCTESSPLLTPEFWDKIYSLKFSPTCTEEKNQTPRIWRITLEDLQTHISSIGKKVNNEHCPEALIKTQRKNTCHFKGLLAALKKEIICAQSPHSIDAVTDWKEFKLAFGDYLLEDKKLDIRIKKQAVKRQEHRLERAEQIALFASTIKEGKYDETAKSYVEAIKNISPRFEYYALNSKFQDLKLLDDYLRRYLSLYLVSPEEMQSLIGRIENPCVASTFNRYKNLFSVKQQELEKEVESELKTASSHVDVLIESVQEKFNEAAYNLFGKHKKTWPINNFNRVPLKEKQIEKYLSLFSNQPELLVHLEQRPTFILILMQSIQLGKMDSIKHIYDSLNDNDKKTFRDAIMYYTIHDFVGSKMYDRLLPKGVLEFYLSNPNHAISIALVPLLMDQVRSEGLLTNLYALVRQDPQSINYMNPEKFQRMKVSREQIEAFFALAADEAGHPDSVDFSAPNFESLLFCAFKKIVEFGLFDLLEKSSPKMQEHFSKFEDLIVLTEENLRQLQDFHALHPQHFMQEFFESTICANQYKLGVFSTDLAKIKVCHLTREFRTELNEFNFNEGLKLLRECNSGDVFNRCLEDLILYASSHLSVTRMQDILFTLKEIKPDGQQFFIDFIKKFASHRCNKDAMPMYIVFLETILGEKEVNQEFLNTALKDIFSLMDEDTFIQVQNLVEKLEKKHISLPLDALRNGLNLVLKFPEAPLSKMIAQAYLQEMRGNLIQANQLLQRITGAVEKLEMEAAIKGVEGHFLTYWKVLFEREGSVQEDPVDLIQRIFPETKAYDREDLQKIFQFLNKGAEGRVQQGV
jgi:hypothetical protein